MSARARTVLGLLLAVNLLNYLDRQILYSLLPLLKSELGASDARLGALASAFMVVYMCAAPPIGYLADRTPRRYWISIGMALWSAATFASGLSSGYWQLFGARAAVGVGESCYGAVSPAFVAEHFPEERRGGALALFSAAIPVGSALGYMLGGWLGQTLGWRAALMAAGLPGLALAALTWRLEEPGPRGGSAPPALREYAALARIPSYLASTLAMAAMTFSLGGLAVWMPTFLTRAWGKSVLEAGAAFGAVTVAAGLFGSLAGGWLGDRLRPRARAAYFIVSGAGLALAMPAGWAALALRSYPAMLGALFVAEALAFLNMGPLNAAIVSVVPRPMRSLAFAANIFVLHALGDALSPTLIGWASDAWGLKPALMASMVMLGAAGGFCAWGARHFEQDSARARGR